VQTRLGQRMVEHAVVFPCVCCLGRKAAHTSSNRRKAGGSSSVWGSARCLAASRVPSMSNTIQEVPARVQQVSGLLVEREGPNEQIVEKQRAQGFHKCFCQRR